MSKKRICIYHDKCTDGFAAAYVVWKRFGDEDTEFFPANYGKPAPDCTGRDVIIVDFSYPLDVMKSIFEQCEELILLDHHKTAVESLGEWINKLNGGPTPRRHSLILDMTRSGALMAWGHFFPGEPAHPIIEHISDRDLWQFKLEGTKEIHAYLSSVEQSFAAWDNVFVSYFSDAPWTMEGQGEAIMRKFNGDVTALVGSLQMELTIDGVTVPAANIPFLFASEAGHVMGKGKPFAACFSFRTEGVAFSLRSAPEGADVSLIAKKYGGGGHQHAAGFQVDYATFQGFFSKPKSDKPYDAELREAVYVDGRLRGKIYGDKRRRWPDGDVVTTSTVTSTDGVTGIVTTKNSRYLVDYLNKSA